MAFLADPVVILKHYHLANPYPPEWPAHKDYLDDTSSEEDEEKEREQASNARDQDDDVFRATASQRPDPKNRRSTRYLILTGRSKGQQQDLTHDPSRQSHVQKDESDPLGGTDTVVRALRKKGLLVDENPELRNRFLLSSTTFSPILYLSQVQSDSSTSSLIQGLEFLTHSIEQKAASLKQLVEVNFERFVRAKATIDLVYEEMKSQGKDADDGVRNHSRKTSKNSGNYKYLNGSRVSIPGNESDTPHAKKLALLKESEYGVQGMRIPLVEASIKADEIWGSAIGGKDRKEAMRAISVMTERYRHLFEISQTLADSMRRRDYDGVIEDFRKARKYVGAVQLLASDSIARGVELTDARLNQVIITAHMYADVDAQLEAFKRELWRLLVLPPSASSTLMTGPVTNPMIQHRQHMELIKVLLELGVKDNPIWVWLLSRYDYLKTKINVLAERSRINIEVLRRRLAISTANKPRTKAKHLRTAIDNASKGIMAELDSTEIVDAWHLTLSSLETLLSPHDGVLREVINFWETAQDFIDGKAQRSLPAGEEDQSKRHHTLSSDGIRDLRNGLKELLNLLYEFVHSFFCSPPMRDIAPVYSPLPGTPSEPRTPYPGESRFLLEDGEESILRSPSSGDFLENYAFWPPKSSALSGVHYLGAMLTLVGNAVGEMTALEPTAQGSLVDKLKALIVSIRERSIQVICHAWDQDSENLRFLEDWTRSPDRRDTTVLPRLLLSYENSVISGIQRILYLSDVKVRVPSAGLVSAPPAKLIQIVKAQFFSSIQKATKGIVENAEKPLLLRARSVDTIALPGQPIDDNEPPSITENTQLDPSSSAVRVLMTQSNLLALRQDLIPPLVTSLESALSITVVNEAQSLRELLAQIDARLFSSFTKPTIKRIHKLCHDGVLGSSWEPQKGVKPTEVRDYAYTGLLVLIKEHATIATTAPSLANQIMAYYLEHFCTSLLEAFKLRAKSSPQPAFSLESLMQATLDVEFVAQILNAFTTDKAAELQSLIYLELDKGTNNEARKKLQDELPGMRATLKGLRERSRGTFGAWKKARRSEAGKTGRESRSRNRTNIESTDGGRAR